LRGADLTHSAHVTIPAERQHNADDGARLQIAPRFESVLAQAGLTSCEPIFNYADGESLTKPGLASWRQRVRLTLPVGGQMRNFFMKRFTNPPAAARREVRRCGNEARSVAGVEWNWLHAFRTAGIPCAEPVALAEEFTRAREKRSAIIMAAVPGVSLETWARAPQSANRATFESLIPATAFIVARMHALGCAHRDLYLAHLFMANRLSTVDNRQSPGPLPDGRSTVGRGSDPFESPTAEAMGHALIHIIDLQRVFRPICCFRRWVVKDLASLHFSAFDQLPRGLLSRTMALRWLKLYLGTARLVPSDKRLAYRVIGRTRNMLRRHGRPRATD